MAPRILLDGMNLALEHGTGVSTYARNLSARLGALGAEVEILYGEHISPKWSPLMREVAFFDDKAIERTTFRRRMRRLRRTILAGLGEEAVDIPVTGNVVATGYAERLPHFDRLWNVEDVFNRAHNRFKWRQRFVPLRAGPPQDLAHWTYPLALRVRGTRNVYTLHDLVPLRLPNTTLDQKRRYFRLCRMIVQSADHVVTVSEASRADIINLLGCPPEKVTNTYQAVDIPARLAGKPESVARDEVMGAFGLPWKGYHLFFGAIEPKKNIARLTEAYLTSGVTTPLVILGKQAWKSDIELRLATQHERMRAAEAAVAPVGEGPAGPRIHLFEYAPFRLLVSLIRGARAVVFPSLYEGFGLPALEAMSLGVPVMTSNTSSLPEVVGDAAVKVDPYDVRAMAEGLRALDRDAELRGHLSEAGPARAAMFGAAAYERRLGELYGRLGVALPGAGPEG